MSANRLAALTGVAFLLLAIISIAVGGGEPPDPTDDSAQEIIDFYVDEEDGVWIGAILQTLAAAALVFYGGYLRKVLHAAEGAGHTLSYVVLAGATILATGLALDATINIALRRDGRRHRAERGAGAERAVEQRFPRVRAGRLSSSSSRPGSRSSATARCPNGWAGSRS